MDNKENQQQEENQVEQISQENSQPQVKENHILATTDASDISKNNEESSSEIITEEIVENSVESPNDSETSQHVVPETPIAPVEKEYPQNEDFKNREHPLLGRKVFFLNPPLSIASFVMENLREEQYEVYSISDYKSAKSILRLYEDSICFIFIDDQMPLNGWYNFIRSFEEDETLRQVFLGAISGRIKPKDKENFLMNLRLPGGFVTLGGAVSDVLENIRGILKINGAKGCRHYVRLECKPNMGISGYLADQLRLYQFAIRNISTAGIAILMEKSKGYKFIKNRVQDNICINLNRKTVVCSAVVYDVKSIDNVDFVILLFTKHTTSSERSSIRQFIFQVLQQEFDVLQSNVLPDEINYTMEGVYGTAKEENGNEVIEDKVILNEVDDLQDEVSKDSDKIEESAEEKTDSTDTEEQPIL